MAVAEYMLTNDEGNQRRFVPGFIGDRGHWYNPVDHTFVGWISENRDFYVPDTIVYLDKAAFVARTLAMHAANPMRKPGENPGMMEQGDVMTEAEVTTMAEQWFDAFVEKNANE
jgi:hypothetical protein